MSLDELHDRVLGLARRYYESLRNVPPHSPVSYSRGLAGLLTFAVWAERNALSDGQVSRLLADQLGDLVAEVDISFGLYDGLCGVLYALENYEAQLGLTVEGLAETRSHFEAAIVDGTVDERVRMSGFDLISGQAGVLLYFTSLSATGSRHGALHLDRMLMTTSDDTGAVPAWLNPNAPSGRGLDLGLSHGQAGVMASMLASAEFAPERRQLADQILKEIWSLRRDDGLPYWTGSSATSRVAWCYGELGILASWVALAGIVRGDCQVLDDMFSAVVGRLRSGDHGMTDGFFCHGASGTALLLASLRRYARFDANELESRVLEKAYLQLIAASDAPHDPRKNDHYGFLDGLPGGIIAAVCAGDSRIVQAGAFAPALVPGSMYRCRSQCESTSAEMSSV